MKRKSLKRKWLKLIAPIFFSGGTLDAFANPTGMTVNSGSATAQQIGSQLNVTVSQLAVLNWSSFNIASGETTTFLQPSSGSVVFNVIGGANPSLIFGNLNANGTVILENANGFYFGPNSMIRVGGSFLATTAPIAPDFGTGATWQFTGMPPLASIINYGQIQVGQGRSLFLIAENIQNYGQLSAPQGNIELAAGQSVLVSDSPDGRSLTAQVQLPQGSVDNFGNIIADAGTIALRAKVVNEDGIIQADSIQNHNGTVELIASDQLNLGANSQISANGDNSAGGSSGGTVTLQSGNNFSGDVGSQISATGGSQGGNGGSIEVSAPNILSLNSSMDAQAQSGWSGGTFLLDPANIILGTSTAGGAINVSTAYAGFSTILLQASGNITLNAGTSWDLSGSTGQQTGQLTLEAGGNIIFGTGSKILDAHNWSVALDAGYNFTSGAVQTGSQNIDLSGGTGTIQLSAGSLNLYAANSILVGTGSIYTTGGGSIFADALSGDINAGTSNGGTTQKPGNYILSSVNPQVSSVLGGISTGAAGGNVTLIAGDDIISVPATAAVTTWPAASGAYGAGNVTLVAGNQVSGNFNLANGAGNIYAGVQSSTAQSAASVLANSSATAAQIQTALGGLQASVMNNAGANGNIGTAGAIKGANSQYLSLGGVTLSLFQGTWNAWAANDIYVNEVDNPNGVFNSNPSQPFVFKYAANAAANFWAGNAITLAADHLTRAVANGNPTDPNMLPIYAPLLTLNAGAGGVTVDSSIILAPSVPGSGLAGEGGLQIITRDGGNLSGVISSDSTTLIGITMSDSSSQNYQTFAQGHAATPLYLGNPNPVVLDISGNIENFGLTVPTYAKINVVGNTYNFGFLGQNLSVDQTTCINVGQTAKANLEAAGLLDSTTDGGLLVGGNITYRGDLTSEILSSPISSSEFDAVIAGDPALAGALKYDPTTGTISFIGVMSAATEGTLLNPTDSNNNPILTGTELAIWQVGVSQLYTDSQSASLGDNGLALSGPGNFNIKAGSIDLGISGGITVSAPDAALAAISPYGANINVTTTGDLNMTTTAIANESYLGGISLKVGGTLNVGGELTAFGDASAPKGIFTTSGGDVKIVSTGDVDLNGSRVAVYDGGNITVESLHGNVNAGTGGAGYVTLNALQLDPQTGLLTAIPATIPGSGILATTVAGSHALLGNILVETPNGSFSASQGGVIQLSFDGMDVSKAATYLLAGYELQDLNGQPLTAGDISAADSFQNNAMGSAAFLNAALEPIGQLVNISPNENVDASGSGIIAQNIVAKATGEVSGLFIGFNSVNLDANQISHALVVGPTVDLTSATQPGPIEVISDNPTTVNGQIELPTAPQSQAPTAQAAPQADNATTVATKTSDSDDDDQKKNAKKTVLAQKTSRVTVTLPNKNSPQAENQSSNPSL
ncbi:MAG TPA: filamentous hemagglutinin N-terminal domain-containing protein [Pseudomonadales bacterium]|nr:filamentous hemagglutinin N-terminal domain-containing protein [Pseudomonadales bacterium]